MLRVAVVITALLALAGCSSRAAVATVNGEAIPFEAVQNLQYDPATELTTAEYVELLDVYIAWTVFTQAARDQHGIQPTAEEIRAEVTSILLESGASTQDEFLEAQNISLRGLELTAVQFLIEAGLEEALASSAPTVPVSDAETALAEYPADFTEVCLAHILLPTEADAAAAKARLEAGADFGELAAELSQDPTSAASGGDLGCDAASQFVPEFTDAAMVEPVGEVFGPLRTDFGYHVMVLNRREAADIADIRDRLQQDALFDTIDAWYVDVLAAADVTVDPDYGVWQSGSTARLVPPPVAEP